MRILLSALMLTTISAAHLAAVTTENFARFHFEDGIERTPESFAGRTVATFAFCKS